MAAKLITGVVRVAKCGPAAIPFPKLPSIPPLSKKSESKITKPVEPVGPVITLAGFPYAPLDPVVAGNAPVAPRYSHFASGSGRPAAVPPFPQPDGIPFVKSSLHTTVFSGLPYATLKLRNDLL